MNFKNYYAIQILEFPIYTISREIAESYGILHSADYIYDKLFIVDSTGVRELQIIFMNVYEI